MEDKEVKPTIIKNTSQAYGYKYSSLADIAAAGVEIPRMRIRPTEFGDYIEYLDEDGEWQLGAKIIVPEMKGCNSAQAYGSALTYARRYTVHLAESLACDDDAKIEKQPPSTQNSKPQNAKIQQPPIDYKRLAVIRGKLPLMRTDEALDAYWKSLTVDKRHKLLLAKDFKKRREEIHDKSKEEHNDQTSN